MDAGPFRVYEWKEGKPIAIRLDSGELITLAHEKSLHCWCGPVETVGGAIMHRNHLTLQEVLLVESEDVE
jgi:hypothetical protein